MRVKRSRFGTLQFRNTLFRFESGTFRFQIEKVPFQTTTLRLSIETLRSHAGALPPVVALPVLFLAKRCASASFSPSKAEPLPLAFKAL